MQMHYRVPSGLVVVSFQSRGRYAWMGVNNEDGRIRKSEARDRRRALTRDLIENGAEGGGRERVRIAGTSQRATKTCDEWGSMP